jgi:allantoin racemase
MSDPGTKLRIWHQSFTTLADLPTYRDALRDRIAALVRPGTEVVLHGQIPGTYSSDYPGGDLGFSALFWLHGLQWIAAAREAERQGFDAMVCATMSNPLIDELRTLVDIPVVGYGEAVTTLSGLYGRRFGMLCFIAGRQDFWPERIRQWGLADRFAGVRGLGLAFDDVIAGLADADARARIVAVVRAAGSALVRETGADVIVPSEMPLNLLLSLAGVHDIDGATVMDGLATSFKIAETLCDLRRLAGMQPSRRGFFHAHPERQRVDQVLAFYGLDQLGKRIPPA